MKQKIILALSPLLISSLIGCTTPSHTQPDAVPERNVSSLSDKKIDDLWVAVNNRKDSLIRSNPQHFWAWMAAHSQNEMGPLLAYNGEITADPHFFNFADVHSEDGSKNGLALVDVDDSGSGAFILDFVRYSLFVKAYVKDQHKNTNMSDLLPDMYDAYVKGLSQDKMKAPPVLQNAINNSRAKLEKNNAAWVAENTNADKKNSLRMNKLGLIDLDKSPKARASAGKDLRDALVKSKKVDQVYDTGFTVNDSGSSRGLSRYWFSVALNKNVNRIIECKELSRPAMDYYKTQDDHDKRIDHVLRYYSDVRTTDSYVMDVGSDSYWCRPREFKFIKRGDIEGLSKDDMRELSMYLAYWIGSKQSLQPKAKEYLATLKNEKKVVSRIDDLINDYERHIDSIPTKK